MGSFKGLLLTTAILFTDWPAYSHGASGSTKTSHSGGTQLPEFAKHDVSVIDIEDGSGQRLSVPSNATAITVRLTAFNKTFVLDLRFNRYMFSSKYVQKTVSVSGEQYHDVSQPLHHCHYTGVVRDFQQSTAAISVCNGIEGYFMTDRETYYIKSQHVNFSFVYRESDSLLPPLKCGTETHSRDDILHSFRNARSMKWPQDKDGTTRVVELYVVVDQSQYLYYGGDTDKVTSRTRDIINVASSVYHPLDIYIALVGIEIWTDSDKITIESGGMTATLDRFLAYRRSDINPKHSNDNAHLITHVAFNGSVLGKAPIGTMCTYTQSGAISSDIYVQVARVGMTVAHEMGHNFGLRHDTEVPGCTCQDQLNGCIMAPMTSGGKMATQWSQCSRTQFADWLSHGIDYCLHNIPDSYSSSACGNGIVDDGEQCDCGSGLSSECNPSCCNSTSCQLIGSARCAAGRCCDIGTCQLKEQATECRGTANECDLPEYCSGTDTFCPTDVYKRDGANCTVNSVSAYCYRGQCRSHESQCQLLWGSKSVVANEQCFKSFNTRGSEAGNCGMDWTTMKFTPCAPSDVKCGQLYCSPATDLAYFKSTLEYTRISAWYTSGSLKNFCNATIIDVGMQLPDPGMAPDGAKCGENKMCFSHSCVDVSSLSAPVCPHACSNHGVCNSLGQCHCDKGYGPPDCSSSGCGGSVHSGSPTKGCVNKEPKNNSGLTAGLCVLFLVIIPLIVVLSLLGYRYRERWIPIWHNFMSKTRSPRRGVETSDGFNNNIAPPTRPTPPSKPPPSSSSHPSVDTSNGGASVGVAPSRAAPRPPGAKWTSPPPNQLDASKLQSNVYDNETDAGTNININVKIVGGKSKPLPAPRRT